MGRVAVVAGVAVVAVVAAGGCDQPPGERPPSTCEEADARIRALSADMTAEFDGPCVEDEECVIVTATGTCPGAGSFSLFDEPILFSKVGAASEYVADRASFVCPREQCDLPDLHHFYVSAACSDEGTCVGIAEDPALVCLAMLDRFEAAVAARPASACALDADCAVVTPEWRCEEHGHVVRGCPVVVAADAVVNVDEAMAAECVEHDFDCEMDAEGCPPEVIARCLEGTCAAG